jgi:hypothetical protein
VFGGERTGGLEAKPSPFYLNSQQSQNMERAKSWALRTCRARLSEVESIYRGWLGDE